MIIIKRKVSLLLTIGIILSILAASMAAVSLYYNMPMTGTIPETAALTMYIDEVEWTNNTEVDYETLTPGVTSNVAFDVHNDGNTVLQIIFYVSGLPSGWDLVYNRNGSTVSVGAWLNGTLALTPDGAASAGTYTWDGTVYVS